VTPCYATKTDSLATVARDRVGSKRSKGLKTARQIGALLHEVVALRGQAVGVARCAHDGREVDLRWGRRESSEIEGREIVRRREAALGACDPAPLLVANADKERNASRFWWKVCYLIVDARIEIDVESNSICRIYSACKGTVLESRFRRSTAACEALCDSPSCVPTSKRGEKVAMIL
jgi:hypothetical protein